MNALNLEKSWRLIPREMSIDYSAFESGLERFVRLDKEGNSIGKAAPTEWKNKGFKNAFVTLEVHAVVDTGLHEIGTGLV